MTYRPPAKELARGRWSQILMHFGIADKFLTKRNGPCPLCGGKDRYRWKDYEGSGSYYCGQCGPGNGFSLIMKREDWDFPTTANKINDYLGTGPQPMIRKPDNKPNPAILIEKILKECRPVTQGDEVSRYLEGRGIGEVPQDILFHPSLFDFETKKYYPVMIGKITDIHGHVICLQRTFLRAGKKAPMDAPRKLISPIGTVNGAAIRLYPLDSHIGIAEGLETAIIAARIHEMPVWSVISANGMKTFELPPEVNELTIFADNDKNFVGQVAAFNLAARLDSKIKVHVNVYDNPGEDWANAYGKKT